MKRGEFRDQIGNFNFLGKTVKKMEFVVKFAIKLSGSYESAVVV